GVGEDEPVDVARELEGVSSEEHVEPSVANRALPWVGVVVLANVLVELRRLRWERAGTVADDMRAQEPQAGHHGRRRIRREQLECGLEGATRPGGVRVKP